MRVRATYPPSFRVVRFCRVDFVNEVANRRELMVLRIAITLWRLKGHHGAWQTQTVGFEGVGPGLRFARTQPLRFTFGQQYKGHKEV